MNINQLRFVQAVAETRSFSQAASKCCVTQPTLSNGIAHLEQELEGKLFERSTRSVSLTPLGKHLLPLIEQILDSLDELKSASRAWHEPEHKLIRIGMSPVVDMKLLQKAVRSFQALYPDVEFFFKECFLDDMDQRLDNGQVDLAFLPAREHRLDREYHPFYIEPLNYLPCDGSPMHVSNDAVELAVIADYPLILTMNGCGLADATRKMFAEQNLNFSLYPGQALSYSVVEEWCALGIGSGVLPRSKLSSDNYSARPLLVNGKPAMLACEFVWKKVMAQPKHVQLFLQHLESFGSDRFKQSSA